MEWRDIGQKASYKLGKTNEKAGGRIVFRLIKWLLYLAILAFIALVGYAYLGPFFGADFTPPSVEIRKEIILDAE